MVQFHVLSICLPYVQSSNSKGYGHVLISPNITSVDGQFPIENETYSLSNITQDIVKIVHSLGPKILHKLIDQRYSSKTFSKQVKRFWNPNNQMVATHPSTPIRTLFRFWYPLKKWMLPNAIRYICYLNKILMQEIIWNREKSQQCNAGLHNWYLITRQCLLSDITYIMYILIIHRNWKASQIFKCYCRSYCREILAYWYSHLAE